MASLNKRVLVTGGAGYVGTHVLVELLSLGFSIVVVDNLVNANVESLRRVREIAKVSSSQHFISSNRF
jgi:UDP-glucose 4-epimerase